jgi:hypothetical protein
MAIAYVDLNNNAQFIHFENGIGPEGSIFKSASQDLRHAYYLRCLELGSSYRAGEQVRRAAQAFVLNKGLGRQRIVDGSLGAVVQSKHPPHHGEHRACVEPDAAPARLKQLELRLWHLFRPRRFIPALLSKSRRGRDKPGDAHV